MSRKVQAIANSQSSAPKWYAGIGKRPILRHPLQVSPFVYACCGRGLSDRQWARKYFSSTFAQNLVRVPAARVDVSCALCFTQDAEDASAGKTFGGKPIMAAELWAVQYKFSKSL